MCFFSPVVAMLLTLPKQRRGSCAPRVAPLLAMHVYVLALSLYAGASCMAHQPRTEPNTRRVIARCFLSSCARLPIYLPILDQCGDRKPHPSESGLNTMPSPRCCREHAQECSSLMAHHKLGSRIGRFIRHLWHWPPEGLPN